MLYHPFTNLKGQVQSGEHGIGTFKALHNTQRMKVMVERIAEALHLAVEFFFPRVGKRRMTDIVDQGKGFNQILIQIQNIRQRPGNLRYFDGMSEAVAEMV